MLAKLLRLSPLLLVFASTSPYALQTIEGRDGATIEASISVREPSRIRIEGTPITDVFGNIYSSSCGQHAPGSQSAPMVNPLGEVVLECDRDKGEIYVRPVGHDTKPINLFVSSSYGTYTLLLRRADIPAETIVIRDRTARAPKASETIANSPAGRSPNHIRAMKTMLIAMTTPRLPSDIAVTDVNKRVQLWVEADFKLLRLHEGRGYIGETYHLTNISPQPMVLTEQEFDREGDVVGIAIDAHNLQPGEATQIYVIRSTQ